MTETTIEWTKGPNGEPGRSWTPRLIARFWSYVKRGAPDECWPWTGGRFDKGYGQFRFGKKKVKAHRCAFELTNGHLPEGKRALHRCDNPPCCNPRHLFAGTDTDNARDRESKGRGSGGIGLKPMPGESNPSAKLDSQKVLNIRQRRKRGASLREIARETGMSQSQIGNIVRGDCWRGGPWPA